MSYLLASFEELEKVREHYHKLHREYWLENDLFSFNWWLLVIATIIPWFIWWKVVDKNKLTPLLLYGLFIAIESMLIDILLTNLLVWGYLNRITYLLEPILLPYDLTMLPVIYMLIYQKFKTWKLFLIVSVLMSLILTYALEPALEWIKIYKEYKFPSLFSFSLYILIAVFAKWIVDKIVQRSD